MKRYHLLFIVYLILGSHLSFCQKTTSVKLNNGNFIKNLKARNVCILMNTSEKGFIITNNQDTVFGTIRLRHGLLIGGYLKNVALRNETTKKTTRYRADRVRRIKFGNMYFQSRKLDGASYYFEEVLAGPVCLYKSYYWSHGGGVQNGVYSQPGYTVAYYMVRGNLTTTVPGYYFKTEMSDYVWEDVSLAKKIREKEPGYGIENLEYIVTEFNKYLLSKDQK